MLLLENMQQYIVTRNKEVINSTQNRISLLKICHVLLYRSSSFLLDIYWIFISSFFWIFTFYIIFDSLFLN